MPDCLAERVGWALRESNRALILNHTRQKCKRPRMGPFSFWRCSESAAEDALPASAAFSLIRGKSSENSLSVSLKIMKYGTLS
jgi:hypothetical protein